MATKKQKDCCAEMSPHPDYSKQLAGLNRIGGQIEGVKRMINERRYCPEILTQLRAARSAINSLEASILETHLDACVNDAFATGDKKQRSEKMAELKELYRKYND